MHDMRESTTAGGRFQIATNLLRDALDLLLIFLIVTQELDTSSYRDDRSRFTLLRGK